MPGNYFEVLKNKIHVHRKTQDKMKKSTANTHRKRSCVQQSKENIGANQQKALVAEMKISLARKIVTRPS